MLDAPLPQMPVAPARRRAEWLDLQLGELLEKVSETIDLDPGASYREVTVRLWGKGVVLRREVLGAEIAAKKRSVVRAGQFILSRIDARNGAAGIVPQSLDGAIVTNDFPVFAVREQRLLPAFLAWLIRSRNFVSLCGSASEGTTNRVRLKEDRFLAARVRLPTLAEQRRIVAHLSTLADQIERVTALRTADEITALWERILIEAFSGRLTARWRGEPAGVVSPARVTSGLPALPASWRYKDVESLVEAGTTITYGIVLPGPHVEGGVPYVRQMDIDDGNIFTDRLLRTTPEIASKHRRSELREGDVLLCVIRNRKVAVVPAGLDGVNLTQGTVRIRPGPQIGADYLAYFLESPIAQGWMQERVLGLDMPRINVAHARAVPVPLAPLDEQAEVVRQLAHLRHLVRTVRDLQGEAIAELEALVPAAIEAELRGPL